MCFGVKAAELSNLNWGQSAPVKWERLVWLGRVSGTGRHRTECTEKNDGLDEKRPAAQVTAPHWLTLQDDRAGRSCLDNSANHHGNAFPAKVYQGCKIEKYRTAFGKGLQLILTPRRQWRLVTILAPVRLNGSYHDYITFNDDLMTNVMKLLRDIQGNTGDFKDIVDEATRERCCFVQQRSRGNFKSR
jgi:PelA/Pel-15E family pectate lyase